MDFNAILIAGAVPLGVLVSLLLSILKKFFGLDGEQSRAVVAVAGLLYFVAASVQDFSIMGVINAIIAGGSLVFSSGGFYDWLGYRLEGKEAP